MMITLLALAMMALVRAPCHEVSAGEPVTLSNGSVRIVITPDLQAARPGSLLEFTDLATGIDMAAGGQFAGVQSDVFLPAPGSISCLSDTEAVFMSPYLYDHTGTDILPMEVSILYRLNGRGLEMIFTVEADADVQLVHPLEVDFHLKAWQNAVFRNQTTLSDRVMDLSGPQGPARVSGDQSVLLDTSQPEHLTASVLFPNPSKSNLFVSYHTPAAPGYLSLRLFDTEPARENCQGPDLHSIVPEGETRSWYVGFFLEDNAVPVFLSGHPCGLERTSSWILDEIPMIHPEGGYIWGFSSTSSGPEPVSAGLIQLLEEHQDMKMNWLILPDGILTPNRDSAWFEPGWEDSWSHWHCTWRISTEATEPFLQWMMDIQNDVYPWADRVNMGSHGYHHTPNPDSSFAEYHEFITYEPEEHLERFMMLTCDIEQMGLDPSAVNRVIRYSGHRTSLSGLWAAIAWGFEFYCNGIRWWDWNGGEYFLDTYISRFETPGGRIWGTNTVWWADYYSMYSCEYLSTVMQRGKHCLLGGHPSQMLAEGTSPEAYARLDSVCTSLENDYEHFGWLFPIEYGEFLENSYGILWERVEQSSTGITVLFSGGSPAGQTAVMLVPDGFTVISLSLDQQPLPWDLRSGNRIFAVLPELCEGEHLLSACWIPTGVLGRLEAVRDEFFVSSPATSHVNVSASGLDPSVPWRIMLFDLSGRLVREWEGITLDSGEMEETLNLRETSGLRFPAGVYMMNLRSGTSSMSATFVVLGG